jgi:hypothetical protein
MACLFETGEEAESASRNRNLPKSGGGVVSELLEAQISDYQKV